MPAVRDIMTPDPVTIQPDTTLDEVMGLMKSNDCRHLLVVEGERLLGMVTDRDVRLAAHSPLVAHDHHEDMALLKSVTAADCMTPNPMTVKPDAPATQAADQMNRYKFGALPVVDGERLVGIVTVSDVLKSYIQLLKTKRP